MKFLLVSEIYKSVQGESSFVGFPCAFIRLTGCPLRCRWCDTSYSFKGGLRLGFSEIIQKVAKLDVRCVEFTGGEPLAQKDSCSLMEEFISLGKQVLLETSGALSLKEVPKKVHVIMDIKCPDSKMSHKNNLDNLAFLKPSDEIKFVLASRDDYLWAKDTIMEYELASRFKVLLSPAWGELESKQLVEWFMEDNLNCRLNLQIHKYIWDETKRGV